MEVSNIEQLHSDRRGSVSPLYRGVASPSGTVAPVRSPWTGAATVLPERTCKAIVIPTRFGSWPLNALRWAERTNDPALRVELLMIAQKWVTMANGRLAVTEPSEHNEVSLNLKFVGGDGVERDTIDLDALGW